MKFIKSLIAFVAFAGVFLAFAAIGNDGATVDSFVFEQTVIYPLIAALGLGIAIFIHQLSEDDYLPIKGLIFLIIALAMPLVSGITAIINLNGHSSYFISFLKYGTLPISMSAAACIYILIGYSKRGVFFELILPIICAIVPAIVSLILKDNDGALIGVAVGFSVAAALVMAAFTFIYKRYPDGTWGSKRRHSSSSSSSYRPKSSSSSSYSSSSGSSSYSSSSSSSYEKAIPSGVSSSSVKSACYGLRAQEPTTQPYVMGSITGVDARSSDGGYNFDITLYIHLHVCQNNFGPETTEDYVRSCAQEVVDKLVDKATDKLDRLDIGYDIDSSITSD